MLPQDPSLDLNDSASFSSQSFELCHPNFACKVFVVCWVAGVCLPLPLCASRMAALAWWNIFYNCELLPRQFAMLVFFWKHSRPLLFIVSTSASSSAGAPWTPTQLIIHFLPKTTRCHLLDDTVEMKKVTTKYIKHRKRSMMNLATRLSWTVWTRLSKSRILHDKMIYR